MITVPLTLQSEYEESDVTDSEFEGSDYQHSDSEDSEPGEDDKADLAAAQVTLCAGLLTSSLHVQSSLHCATLCLLR